MQEIVFGNIYFQKNNINLLLNKFKTQKHNTTSPSPGLARACSGMKFVKFTFVLWDYDRI